MKVFIEGNDQALFKMFKEEGFSPTFRLEEADLVCLEGGADVTPALYKQRNTHSGNSTNKDISSFGLLFVAHKLSIPVVGICRGSQVMNVYHGGSMKQHIDGHAIMGGHPLIFEGKTYQVSSAHHQESVPIVDESYITRSEDGVCEIVEYPDHKMLGFQPHPEYHYKGHECRTLFFSLIDRIMNVYSVMQTA